MPPRTVCDERLWTLPMYTETKEITRKVTVELAVNVVVVVVTWS